MIHQRQNQADVPALGQSDGTVQKFEPVRSVVEMTRSCLEPRASHWRGHVQERPRAEHVCSKAASHLEYRLHHRIRAMRGAVAVSPGHTKTSAVEFETGCVCADKHTVDHNKTDAACAARP